LSDPRPSLRDRLIAEVRERGDVSFARFMELALYDPEGGYYAAGGARIGTEGDFFTASDAGREFGRALARQLAEIDRVVGPFDPFRVLEYGAGRGLLAQDVTEALAEREPALARRLRYTMIDRSERMRREAVRRAVRAGASAAPPAEPVEGCVLAVELFDALPCHRVRRRGGELVEVRVGLDERSGELAEREVPARGAVRELAERYGAAATDGSEAEVAPAALEQLDTMIDSLRRGVIAIVDYGDDAAGLAAPHRARGTLLAYHGHATNEDWFERIGEQDLTAHVNFTALEDRARERGLAVLGRTTQDRFLIANGILEAFESSAGRARPGAAEVKRRMQAMQLIHPSGMGRAFQVLLLAQGCDPPPPLAGLVDPFARGGDILR
jgi:SAM-dependent MidA family methyltransferase